MLKKKFLILVFNQTGKFTLLLIYKIFKKIIVKVLFHFFSKKHRVVIQSALDKLNCDLKRSTGTSHIKRQASPWKTF